MTQTTTNTTPETGPATGPRDTNQDATEIRKFGQLSARWWDEAGPLATLHAINPLRADYLSKQAEIAGSRILDVGCGGGILSESLARRGAQVTGIDLAADSIEVARKHAADASIEVDYRLCAVESLTEAEAGSYDIVTCLEVLEHVPRPDQTVAACAAMVRPGGLVVFSTLNRTIKSFALAIVGAEYVLGMLPRGTHQYLKFIKPSELSQAARSAGLTIHDLTGLHFNPLTKSYYLNGNVHVNYFLSARRPEGV